MIGKKTMKALRENIGEEVVVEFVCDSDSRKATGILKRVKNFVNIKIGDIEFPFIGYNIAIQRITNTKTGKLLYQNLLIPDLYELKENKEIDNMRALTFGKKIALNLH